MSAIKSNFQKYQIMTQNTSPNYENRSKTTKIQKYVQYQPGDENIKFDEHIVQYLKPIEISNEKDLSKLLNGGLSLNSNISINEDSLTQNIESPKDNLRKKLIGKNQHYIKENKQNISQNNNEKFINDFYMEQKIKDEQQIKKKVFSPKITYTQYNTIENDNQQNLNINKKNDNLKKKHFHVKSISNPNIAENYNNEDLRNSLSYSNNPPFEKIDIEYERPTTTKIYRNDPKQQIYKNINSFSNKQNELPNLEINYQQKTNLATYNNNQENYNKINPLKNYLNSQIISESINNNLQNKNIVKLSKKSLSTSKNNTFNYSLPNQNLFQNDNQLNNYNTFTNNSNNIQIVMENNKINISAAKIQRKWRGHYLINLFNTTQKEKLISECEEFINNQYKLCDKEGQIIINNFDPNLWQKFYKNDDSFFITNPKILILKKAIKIINPNDPKNISIYEGEINIKNQKHGYGMLTTPNMVYIGNWENDKFTGWGRITKRNGVILEGKFFNGVLEGKGIVENGQGGKYIGDFRNSKRHGKGILETEKIYYDGDFLDDKFNGNGKIIFKKENHSYEGEFLNNEINGYGIFKWNNGDYYEGEMKNGKMNGKGKYVNKNGYVFSGKYINDVKQPGGVEFRLDD